MTDKRVASPASIEQAQKFNKQVEALDNKFIDKFVCGILDGTPKKDCFLILLETLSQFVTCSYKWEEDRLIEEDEIDNVKELQEVLLSISQAFAPFYSESVLKKMEDERQIIFDTLCEFHGISTGKKNAIFYHFHKCITEFSVIDKYEPYTDPSDLNIGHTVARYMSPELKMNTLVITDIATIKGKYGEAVLNFVKEIDVLLYHPIFKEYEDQ